MEKSTVETQFRNRCSLKIELNIEGFSVGIERRTGVVRSKNRAPSILEVQFSLGTERSMEEVQSRNGEEYGRSSV
jgi:hypothetical protein